MRLGFTGTQDGMTPLQMNALGQYLDITRPEEVHHGMCIGADEELDHMLGYYSWPTKIVGHPGVDYVGLPSKRGNTNPDLVLSPFPYIVRNHNIVNKTEALWATPRGMLEERRSGTWATIRYAKKIDRPVIIFYPDGTFSAYNYEGSDLELPDSAQEPTPDEKSREASA